MPSFNLLDEPWIPCAERAGAATRLLSLRAVFAEAPRLIAVSDSSPAVTISLYRLLLAILHRSLDGPQTVAEWKRIFDQGQWDIIRINHYLDRWHDRFDLFDAQHPFYQTPDLPLEKAPSATQLAPERASDRNRSLLFDHTSADPSLSPAEAARYLVAMQNFAVGGLISLPPGEPIANKTTTTAPLLGVAVVLVRDDTLFKTLMLNWLRYNRDDQVPFPFTGNDQPAWEREGGVKPEKRLPDGYVDLLTWQSRRILLIPALSPDGRLRVQTVHLMKGYQFAEGFEPKTSETMVAFRRNTSKNSPNGPAWLPIRLSEDRLVWRDSQTLIQTVASEQQRPKTMDWLDTLMEKQYISHKTLAPLDIYGLIPDQANIRDWRRESLPLPLRLLNQQQAATPQLLERLSRAVKLAEEVGRLFDVGGIPLTGRERPMSSPMWELCKLLLIGDGEREPRRDDCANLAKRFAAGPRYWSRLDTPFRLFIRGLEHPDVLEEGGMTRYGMDALRVWTDTVRSTARDVFHEVTNDLDTSARALHAWATAEQLFNYLLVALLSPYQAQPLAPEVERLNV